MEPRPLCGQTDGVIRDRGQTRGAAGPPTIDLIFSLHVR